MARNCENCGSATAPRNPSGRCAKCRRTAVRPTRRRNLPDNCPWLLPPVYDLDTGEEIVDHVAIDIAVEGRRRVGLTITEREEVIRRMILGAATPKEMAQHIGTVPVKLEPIFNKLGYELISPRRGDESAKRTGLRRIKEASNA